MTTEERKKQIEELEDKYKYPISSLLKERLLITTDERFTRKMNELTYYATNGSVYTFAK